MTLSSMTRQDVPASANTVRGCSGSTVGPSGSHYIIGPLQKASGPRKKEKTAMSHFWDAHHKGLQRQSSCAESTSIGAPNRHIMADP